MSKSKLSERDICTKYITPALEQAGWDIHSQIREEYSLTAGRIVVRGKLHTRQRPKRADYVLFYKPNIPIAIIEAKDNKHAVGDGIQQALNYAEMLQVPFVFSSNGDGFVFHNKISESDIETNLGLHEFPSPESLWEEWITHKGLVTTEEKIVTQDYYTDGSGKTPRYYQLLAINKTVEAIARGDKRILLVMATGTGKTYTAFQIIWRLWKSRKAKRILFLADLNILVDQTMTNDFKPFGSKMTKIQKRQADKSYEIYLSLYQAVTSNDEDKNIYKQFSRDFFDLIVVDECHRGSAKEDSRWREILEYFTNATHIGLTATPKETKEISNTHYFGEPIYSYSLKQGIDDGFLAPYKVIRIDFDKDGTGWRPEKGKTDKNGQIIEDRVYNRKDFDKKLVLEKRTDLVAAKVTEYLQQTNEFDKTIIFCEDTEHAGRMRQAVLNANPEQAKRNPKYAMRITGNDPDGKKELDNFIFPKMKYPVVATTSQLLSTGVDAQTCKLIVLDKNIQSTSTFKQIIGRGTRINEDYGKYYFTIMDFKKATDKFSDPDFDGDPVVIYEPTGDDPIAPPEDDGDPPSATPEGDNPIFEPWIPGEDSDDGNNKEQALKFYVNDVAVTIIAERVQYIDKNGKLITESLKDYTRKTIGKKFSSIDDFLRSWNDAKKKQAIIDELAHEGIIFEALEEEVGKEYDPFDLLCHIAWDMPPLTRKERADNVRKRNYFTKYGEQARKVLEALLDKYTDEGVTHIEKNAILTVAPFTDIGTPLEIAKQFGGRVKYEQAVQELEEELYCA